MAAKTSTKLHKYSASGRTHRSGIGGSSVVRDVVTPSMRLDGMKASASHLIS